MKLRELLEGYDSRMDAAKALYDRPGTAGEKDAAKAAMDRMKQNRATATPQDHSNIKTYNGSGPYGEHDFSDHISVLKKHGFDHIGQGLYNHGFKKGNKFVNLHARNGKPEWHQAFGASGDTARSLDDHLSGPKSLTNEAEDVTFHKNMNGREFPVLKNPSSSDVRHTVKNSRYDDVRILKHNNDHYMWDANDGLHHEVGKKLGLKGNASGSIFSDHHAKIHGYKVKNIHDYRKHNGWEYNLNEGVKSKLSGWEHIQQKHPDKSFEDHPGKMEDSVWHLDNNLKPVIHLSKTMVNHDYKTMSKEDFYKDYHHPFHGVIPHEHDEATVSLRLMKGEHEQVYKQYPKFKESKYSKNAPQHLRGKSIEGETRRQYPPKTDSQFKHMAKHNPKLFDDYQSNHGGIAHYIITSPDSKGYDEHCYKDRPSEAHLTESKHPRLRDILPMSKTKPIIKTLNPIAQDLRTPKYRSQTIQSKKIYDRKKNQD